MTDEEWPKDPSQSTLDRYGLSLDEWRGMAGSGCAICERPWGPAVKPVTDHRHVRGWKLMLPEDRKKYVRGVICVGCNHWVMTRVMTPLKARNAARYMENYDDQANDA